MRLRRDTEKPVVVLLHYPPVYNGYSDTVFTQVLDRYPIHAVVYGHLHGGSIALAFNGERRGVPYRLVSCDALQFHLAELDFTGQ